MAAATLNGAMAAASAHTRTVAGGSAVATAGGLLAAVAAAQDGMPGMMATGAHCSRSALDDALTRVVMVAATKMAVAAAAGVAKVVAAVTSDSKRAEGVQWCSATVTLCVGLTCAVRIPSCHKRSRSTTILIDEPCSLRVR